MTKFLYALLLASLAAMLLPALSLAGSPVRRSLEPLASPPQHAVNGTRYALPGALRDVVHPRGERPGSSGRMLAPRTATGPCTVTGRVLGFDNRPLAGVGVVLSYRDSSDAWYFVDSVSTSADGSFAFVGVPETNWGEIDAYLVDGDGYHSWGNTFTAAGPNDFQLRPGVTGVQTVRSAYSGWNWWQWLRVETWGSRGGATTWLDGGNGDAFVMAPDYDYAIAYPYDNQGIEWSASAPLSVVPGASVGNSMTFDQDADGRGAWIQSPYWQSGKAGTRTTLVLENWPAGYQMSFYGYSQAPSAQFKDWPFYVESDGSQYSRTSLTIPSTASAGYDYEVHVYRYDDSASYLDLTLYYQVASLKPSRTSIRRGGDVRLSGIVPTQGHMGSQQGKAKYVTLYQRTKSAGPPTTWDATKKGWQKVGSFRANGYGKYQTRLLHPKRTTWYVVRYPGDNWYFDAYTSVSKVSVR